MELEFIIERVVHKICTCLYLNDTKVLWVVNYQIEVEVEEPEKYLEDMANKPQINNLQLQANHLVCLHHFLYHLQEQKVL